MKVKKKKINVEGKTMAKRNSRIEGEQEVGDEYSIPN